jgi:Predicted signal transduction protein with a C-terminal ATPase domain
MKMRFALGNKINDIPLKYKFLMIYILCVLLPIIVINLVFLTKITALVSKREAENFQIAMERARTDIVSLIQDSVAVSHSISTDKLLYEALDRKYGSFNDFYDTYNSYLRNRLNRYASIYNFISDLKVYSTNSSIASSGYYLYIDDEVKNSEWYQALARSNDMIILNAYEETIPGIAINNDQYLCVIRKMNEYTLPNTNQNYVKINIDINKIFEIFNREQNYINICLVDENNKIIYSPDNPLFYRLTLKTPNNGSIAQRSLDYNPKALGKDSIIREYKLGNANYLSDWKIVGIMDRRIILKALSQSRYFIFYLALISMLVATVSILIIVQSFNHRFKKLAKHMTKVENQQFELIETAEGKDEIGGLIRNFNLMTAKINSLINDVYKLKIQKQDLELERVRAELNFLQSQMNPHFLFNTLNALLVVCIKNNYSEVVEVIKYLAKTLRRLLSWNDDLVTIDEEMAFSEMYLKIEKFRFGEKFRYELAVDDGALQCRIPKMTIQPLIENACEHGIQAIKAIGVVKVKIDLTAEMLKVTVTDNGSGIDGEKLAEIRNHMAEGGEGNENIGLRNVYRRLRLYYGEDVEFSISSRINSGTAVGFVVPVQRLKPLEQSEEELSEKDV